jgi:N-acetylmuramoyl-L-alanine amidase
LKVISSQKGLAGVLLVASLLAGPAYSFCAVSPDRRQAAIAAFDHAQRLRTTLESQPESQRKKSDYRKVIDAFREVCRLNPAYGKTPVALAAVAELYEEMGRVFASDSYYLESIKTYRFLIKEYPQNRIARDALFTVGEIYRTDLVDREEARKTFQDFLKMYPKSDKLADAQEKLRQVDLEAAGQAKAHAVAPPPEEPRVEGHVGPPEVTAVRRWVGPNYSRIVIGVEGEVKFDTVRLSNPDRIVLNLLNARLNPALVGKTFPVEDGFLRQIRVAQFSADVTRVVLDVEKIEDYSVFSLPNPFRLVIDVHGVPQPETAKATKPALPAQVGTLSGPQGRMAEKLPSAPASDAVTSGARSDMAAKPPPPAPRATGAKTGSLESTAAGDKEMETASQKPPVVPETRKQPKTEAEMGAAPAVQPGGPTESGSRTLTRALGLKIGRIVIDPGHGGHDTGTIGPTGLNEKDVVLDVALRLKKLLEQSTGCEVILTRSDDTFIPLEERTAIANEKGADLFISVHANASRDLNARGIETYYLNLTSSPEALEVAARENATSQESVHELQNLIKKIAMTEKIEESQDLAKQVQREVYTHMTKASGAQRDRGVKKAPFVVLIGANMPSVLAEISFLTNPSDERMLKRPDYREKIASALYSGIVEYVKNVGEVATVARAASRQSSAAARPDF